MCRIRPNVVHCAALPVSAGLTSTAPDTAGSATNCHRPAAASGSTVACTRPVAVMPNSNSSYATASSAAARSDADRPGRSNATRTTNPGPAGESPVCGGTGYVACSPPVTAVW